MIPQIGYDVHGPADAPVLVLGSSLGTDRRMWDPQLAALSRRYRVVRYDHRGHGDSPAPPGPYAIADLGADVIAVLDSLGVQRCHLGGLSLGGMVALWLAAHHPDRVASLALFCTSAHLPPAQGWLDRATAARADGTGSIADAVVARWLTPGFAAGHGDQVAALRAMLERADDDGYASCCEAIAAMDLRSVLPRISTPTLVVAAYDDPATPAVHARTIAAGIGASARVELVDGAHLATVENPHACTALLLEHLDAVISTTAGIGATAGAGAVDEAAATDGVAGYQAGLRVRRAVLGDAHVERATANATDFTRPFQEFITEHVWGAVWTRPELDRRERSLITLALLAGLGRAEELPLHVRGALNNGLTVEQIREVLLHTAVYAGVPASNTAFAVAARTLDQVAAERDAGDHEGPDRPPADER